MNYRRIHDAIIQRARDRSDSCIVESYYEVHHVIPKCIGVSVFRMKNNSVSGYEIIGEAN